jgi:hypothetical protein
MARVADPADHGGADRRTDDGKDEDPAVIM